MDKEKRAKKIKLFIIIISLIFLTYGIINGYLILKGKNYTDDCMWLQKEKGLEIASIVKGGVTDKAGIKEGDILTKMDGKIFKTPTEAQKYINSLDENSSVEYTVLRRDIELKLMVKLRSTPKYIPLIMYLVGFVFLFVCFTIIITNPLNRISHLYFYFSFIFFMFLVFNATPPDAGLITIISRNLKLFTIALWAPAILHFFTFFPKRIFFFKKHPRFIILFYIPSVAFILIRVLKLVRPNKYLTYLIALYFILSFISLIFNYIKIKELREKKPLRIIIAGTFLGLLPLAAFLLLQEILLKHLGYWTVLTALGMMILLPLSFGYAVMKYGLMDTAIVIKKSIVYSLTTGIFISLYLVFALGIGDYLASSFGIERRIFHPIIIAIIGFAFNPVRERIQDFVDRKFYKKQYDYQKTLLQLSRELQTQIKIDSIAKKLISSLKTTLHTDSVAIIIEDNDDKNAKRTGKKDFRGNCEKALAGTSSTIKKYLSESCTHINMKMTEDIIKNGLVNEGEISKLKAFGITLIIPMCHREHLIGIIIFGEKSSGDHYTKTDIDLLNTIAAQAAIAVENGKMHNKELKNQKVIEELKMAKAIQQELLPKEAPHLKGLEVSGCSIPALEVGGDYFDYIQKSENRLLVFIGDVSGKGMPASLYMSKVQGMIQIAGSLFESPKEILTQVNKKIFEGIEKKSFITMMAVQFDTKTKKAIICRAGHNTLFIKKGEKVNTEIIRPEGTGLGIIDGNSFSAKLSEETISFNKGDYFILYSDGLTEAMNRNYDLFGEEKVINIINSKKYSSPEELRDLLLKKTDKFRNGAEQNDDITIVIVKIR